MSMDIGDFVRNARDTSMLRFGTITRKDLREDGWAYYAIRWHDDVQYEASVMLDEDDTRRKKMWYRVDELCHADLYHLERSVYLHRRSNAGREVKENIPVC